MQKTKFLPILIGLSLLLTSCSMNQTEQTLTPEQSPVTITPISHATAVINWQDLIIYTDPTGGSEAFADQRPADLILITDIHGDHLDPETLSAVVGNATLIIPQAVQDQLPADLLAKRLILNNGESVEEEDLKISAIPMYNLPESPDSPHTKGRGNGYIIEKDGFRLYIAGDTAGIREMRALKDIDIALIPMNLPYTMDIEEAADAVLEFKPKQVYPYQG